MEEARDVVETFFNFLKQKNLVREYLNYLIETGKHNPFEKKERKYVEV